MMTEEQNNSQTPIDIQEDDNKLTTLQDEVLGLLKHNNPYVEELTKVIRLQAEKGSCFIKLYASDYPDWDFNSSEFQSALRYFQLTGFRLNTYGGRLFHYPFSSFDIFL